MTQSASNTPGSDCTDIPSTAIMSDVLSCIPLISDVTALNRQVASLISRYAAQPHVVMYSWDDGRSDYVEDFQSSEVPKFRLADALPVPASGDITPAMVRITTYELTGAHDSFAITLPMPKSETSGGLALIVDPDGELPASKISLLKELGSFLTPVIAVAREYAFVKSSAIVDPRTGVFTFEYLVTRLEEELGRAQRKQRGVAVLLLQLMEIGDFERAYGLDPTDRLLKLLARGIGAAVRESDIVASWRRSGFAILLPESDIQGANLVIERVARQFEQIEPQVESRGDASFSSRFAAGLASHPEDGADRSSLLLVAEQRLHEQTTEYDDNQ